jgi:hypothetical protein
MNFANAASKVYMNTNGNVNPNIKEAYLEAYIKLRTQVLRSQSAANLSRVANGAFRRPTQTESTAALKVINKSAINNLKYMRIRNIHLLRPGNRGLAARGFATGNANRLKKASTQVRINYERALRTTNNVNKLTQNTKNTLNAQMAEINRLLSSLSEWSTNILRPGAITNSNKTDLIRIITAARSKVDSELLAVNAARAAIRPILAKLSRSAKEEAERRAAEQIARFAPQPAPPTKRSRGE